MCLYSKGCARITTLNKKTSLNKKNNDKQIFEKTIDAFFANDVDRNSVKKYIFKLFDDMID
jgi:hypothetical protein